MTAAIILAAGSSSRMGQSKQMLEIHGESLLAKTVDAIVESKIGDVVVVLGAREGDHKALLQGKDIDIIFNAAWKNGMGSSLKEGLAYLLKTKSGLESVLVAVCDQPLLDAHVITSLVDKFRESGKSIVASVYSGKPGVPAIFSRHYFQELMSLPDTQGAKRLIVQNHSDVAVVPFPGGEIDLDTMEDYENFLSGKHLPRGDQ